MTMANVEQIETSPAITRTVRYAGTLEALTPIVHGGDEKTGSTPVLRSISHFDPVRGELVRLPHLSGNAIRGMLRRLVMHDLLAQLGVTAHDPRLWHALMSGGMLESVDEREGVVDLELRRTLRELIPALGLFGTAISNQMVPSCLRVDHAIPICREYAAYLGPLADDPRAQLPVRSFTDVAFATRRDDLRAPREEDEQAHQMLVEFEAFIPGSKFVHAFTLVYPSALEAACLARAVALWQEQPIVGGKSASGYGRVAIHYEGLPDPEPYLAFLRERREKVVQALTSMFGRL